MMDLATNKDAFRKNKHSNMVTGWQSLKIILTDFEVISKWLPALKNPLNPCHPVGSAQTAMLEKFRPLYQLCRDWSHPLPRPPDHTSRHCWANPGLLRHPLGCTHQQLLHVQGVEPLGEVADGLVDHRPLPGVGQNISLGWGTCTVGEINIKFPFNELFCLCIFDKMLSPSVWLKMFSLTMLQHVSFLMMSVHETGSQMNSKFWLFDQVGKKKKKKKKEKKEKRKRKKKKKKKKKRREKNNNNFKGKFHPKTIVTSL